MEEDSIGLPLSCGESAPAETEYRKKLWKRIGQMRSRIDMKVAALLEHPDVPRSFKDYFRDYYSEKGK